MTNSPLLPRAFYFTIWHACHSMIRSPTVMNRATSTHLIPGRRHLTRRLAQRCWLLALLALLPLLTLLVQRANPIYAAPATQSVSDPLVVAFYYPWFDQNTWTYDLMNDLPAEPYVSADRGVMGRHIDQAKRGQLAHRIGGQPALCVLGIQRAIGCRNDDAATAGRTHRGPRRLRQPQRRLRPQA